ADPDDDNDGVVDLEDYYPYDKNAYLEPFWWWWIIICVFIALLIFMTFLGMRKPGEILGPEEEYGVVAKKPLLKPKRKKGIKPERKPVPKPKPKRVDRRFKEDGTPKDEAEPKIDNLEEIECPACGQTFVIEIKDLPTEIQCPFCGVTGALD
ncbi:MAG: hypothetical protein JSV56_07765, partial [Methanomassiliicoccales archaeon]